jgi:hypothetical protein
MISYDLVEKLSLVTEDFYPFVPYSLIHFVTKLMWKGVFMEEYKIFEQQIEMRVFVSNMNNQLLDKSIRVLKAEKRRRIKTKINNFLNFNLFKV